MRPSAERLAWRVNTLYREVPRRVDLIDGHIVAVTFVNPTIWRGETDGLKAAKDPLVRKVAGGTAAQAFSLFGPGTAGGVDSVEVMLERVKPVQRLLGSHGKRSWTVKRAFGPAPVIQAGTPRPGGAVMLPNPQLSGDQRTRR